MIDYFLLGTHKTSETKLVKKYHKKNIGKKQRVLSI